MMRTIFGLCLALFGVSEPIIAESNSQLITLENKGISLRAPQGWTIQRDVGAMTLLMEPSKVEKNEYLRTIQLFVFNGSKYIDDVSAHEIGSELVDKYSGFVGAVSGYQLRDHQVITLDDGNSAILFYADFDLQGVSMMQAHIAFSGAKFNYLMTYTDIAENFGETVSAQEIFQQAWNSLLSASVSAKGPSRISTVDVVVTAGALLIGLLFFIGLHRFYLHRKKLAYEVMVEELEYQDDEYASSWQTNYGKMRSAITAIQLDQYREQRSAISRHEEDDKSNQNDYDQRLVS